MKFLFTLFLLVVLAAAVGAAWLWYGVTQPYQGFGAEGVFVEVPHGVSSRSVGRVLQREGVIRSALAFELYARHKRSRTVQAGEYFFDHATSARDVFWKMVKGDVYEQPFTVHEGDTKLAGTLEAVLWQMVAHNSYHVGQIAMLRRTLGAWPPRKGGDRW